MEAHRDLALEPPEGGLERISPFDTASLIPIDLSLELTDAATPGAAEPFLLVDPGPCDLDEEAKLAPADLPLVEGAGEAGKAAEEPGDPGEGAKLAAGDAEPLARIVRNSAEAERVIAPLVEED